MFREKKMWIVVWKDNKSGRTGALKCPDGQSREEADGHARALRALFPERTFRIGRIGLEPGRTLQ